MESTRAKTQGEGGAFSQGGGRWSVVQLLGQALSEGPFAQPAAPRQPAGPGRAWAVRDFGCGEGSLLVPFVSAPHPGVLSIGYCPVLTVLGWCLPVLSSSPEEPRHGRSLPAALGLTGLRILFTRATAPCAGSVSWALSSLWFPNSGIRRSWGLSFECPPGGQAFLCLADVPLRQVSVDAWKAEEYLVRTLGCAVVTYKSLLFRSEISVGGLRSWIFFPQTRSALKSAFKWLYRGKEGYWYLNVIWVWSIKSLKKIKQL